MWGVHQGLWPPLPFPQPVHRSGKPPPLHLLHPLHGDSPPSFCCLSNKLPVRQNVCWQSQLVIVADIVGGRVLGRGHDDYECADAPVGGVATDRAVWCRRHGNDHLLQILWKLCATEVTRTALGHSTVISAGGTETCGQRTHKRGENGHRHLTLSVCLVCVIAHSQL